MAILITERKSAAKAEWEAEECSKHFGYIIKGKAGAQRSIPMRSAKSLAARFYKPQALHAPTGVYPKRVANREDDNCWLSGGIERTVTQMREHLVRCCSWWRDQQKMLWKAVGKATGWNAGRCRHVQISEMYSRDECNQAMMYLLGVTEEGKFGPK